MLLGQGKTQRAPKKWMTVIVGIAAGILSGLFGVGVLLAAYVSRMTDTASEFKANISIVFLAENVFRVLLYAMLGMITPAALKSALLLMPAMLASLFAGIAVSSKINDHAIKKLVLFLLIFSGAVLILQNIG